MEQGPESQVLPGGKGVFAHLVCSSARNCSQLFLDAGGGSSQGEASPARGGVLSQRVPIALSRLKRFGNLEISFG